MDHFSRGFAGNAGKQPCIDRDGDGYGRHFPAGPDCDDANAAIHPGASEVRDGVDNDCDGAVDESLAIPDPTTAVVAVPGHQQAQVAWTAPLYQGTSPITGYTVTSSPGGISASTAGATSVVVTGLTNGVSYSSPWSPSMPSARAPPRRHRLP